MSDAAAEFFKQAQPDRQSPRPPVFQASEGFEGVGDDGDQGPQGAQGAVGFQGWQGVQGVRGPQGVQGPQGISPKGATGAQGAAGDPGPAGTQGLKGPQGVQGAQGPMGEQGDEGTQGPDGVKINALVRAGVGHVALYCNEAPEVWFFDFVRIPGGEERTARVDPLFIEACEPGSLFVQSVSEPFEAFLSEDQAQVHVPGTIRAVVVTLYGVRKHFAGVRFTRHTENQYQQNLRFWGRAYTS